MVKLQFDTHVDLSTFTHFKLLQILNAREYAAENAKGKKVRIRTYKTVHTYLTYKWLIV